MWPFSKIPKGNDLRHPKAVYIKNRKFIIQKLNPLLDFPSNKIPQFFTDFISKRETKADFSIEAAQRSFDEMKNIISKGVINPKPDKDMPIDDFFVDPELGYRLYVEIIIHSVNRFSGLRGLFFSIKTKLSIYTQFRQNLDNLQLI